MAISYYVLESKKIKGTVNTEETWNAKLSKNHVNKEFAEVFYTYLKKTVKDNVPEDARVVEILSTINDVNVATTSAARYAAYKKLEDKFSDNQQLIACVEDAWKLFNSNLKDQVKSGSIKAINQEGYDNYYNGSAKPEYSFVKYYKEKLYIGKEPEPYGAKSAKTTKAKKVKDTINAQTTQTTIKDSSIPTTQTIKNNNTNTPATKKVKEIALPKKPLKVDRGLYFLGRHGALITFSLLSIATLSTLLIPSTLFAVSAMSFMSIVMVSWATAFSIAKFSSAKHAIKRNKLREESIKYSKQSQSELKAFNIKINQIDKMVEGNHPNKASLLADQSVTELKHAITNLKASLSKLSCLYDNVNDRAIALAVRHKVVQENKLRAIPIAVQEYVQSFAITEIAIRKYNEKLTEANKSGKVGELKVEHIDTWDSLKKESYKYFKNELNYFYQVNEFVRDPESKDTIVPRLISDEGEPIRREDWEEYKNAVKDRVVTDSFLLKKELEKPVETSIETPTETSQDENDNIL